MIMGDGEKKYRKLRVALAKNDYRKESRFFWKFMVKSIEKK
jgi:hypothetical protein